MHLMMEKNTQNQVIQDQIFLISKSFNKTEICDMENKTSVYFYRSTGKRPIFLYCLLQRN